MGIEVAGIEEDGAGSVEIVEAEEETDGAITGGREAPVGFEVIEAEVEEEGMGVANKPSGSSRKMNPHVAKLYLVVQH